MLEEEVGVQPANDQWDIAYLPLKLDLAACREDSRAHAHETPGRTIRARHPVSNLDLTACIGIDDLHATTLSYRSSSVAATISGSKLSLM